MIVILFVAFVILLSTTMCPPSFLCPRDTVYQPFLASSTCDVLQARLFVIGVRMHRGG